MTMQEDTEENRRTVAAYLDPLREQVQPVDVGLFAGAMDYSKLSFIYRLVIKAMKVPEGDFRNWDAIRNWAANLRPLLLGTWPLPGPVRDKIKEEEMDHIKVLKRAFEITWRYRALWVFGIILALTTGGGGGGGGGGNGGSGFPSPGGRPHVPEIPPQVVGALIAIGIALACVIIILSIAALVARYVAETALIRMVDDHEETGEKRSVRQGFRLGWSRTAWRLFLMDLLIGVPVVLAFILLFLMTLAPLLLWTTKNTAAGVVGTVATIGLVVLFVLLAIVVGVVLSLLKHFFWRVCALEAMGVIESIRQGYSMVKQHLKDVAIMWLIMVGLGLGLIIVMFPITILLLGAGGVLGGLPALLVGGLSSLLFEGATPWILAGAVGIPICILVIAVPSLFLRGLVEVFKSSVWTLTYRELRALENLETVPGPSPELDAPGLG